MSPYVLALLCLPILTLPTQAQWDLQDSRTTASLRGIDNVGGASLTVRGQRANIMIKTLKCDEGRIIHPIHVSVSVFDAGKIPEIMRCEHRAMR
jgi:hypothetical protein